jgi:hypothetical protein
MKSSIPVSPKGEFYQFRRLKCKRPLFLESAGEAITGTNSDYGLWKFAAIGNAQEVGKL